MWFFLGGGSTKVWELLGFDLLSQSQEIKCKTWRRTRPPCCFSSLLFLPGHLTWVSLWNCGERANAACCSRGLNCNLQGGGGKTTQKRSILCNYFVTFSHKLFYCRYSPHWRPLRTCLDKVVGHNNDIQWLKVLYSAYKNYTRAILSLLYSGTVWKGFPFNYTVQSFHHHHCVPISIRLH